MHARLPPVGLARTTTNAPSKRHVDPTQSLAATETHTKGIKKVTTLKAKSEFPQPPVGAAGYRNKPALPDFCRCSSRVTVWKAPHRTVRGATRSNGGLRLSRCMCLCSCLHPCPPPENRQRLSATLFRKNLSQKKDASQRQSMKPGRTNGADLPAVRAT